MRKLPDDFYVHIKTFFAGRPLVCDLCNQELWYPYSEKYKENSFYCMVLNERNNLIVYQLLCEKCMKKYEHYDDVTILKKSEVPNEVVKAINSAITDCKLAIIPQDDGRIYFSYFDHNAKDIDSSYLTPEDFGFLSAILNDFKKSSGTVIEILD